MRKKAYTWEESKEGEWPIGEVCKYRGVAIGMIAHPRRRGWIRYYTPILTHTVPHSLYFDDVRTKQAAKLFVEKEHRKRMLASVESALVGGSGYLGE